MHFKVLVCKHCDGESTFLEILCDKQGRDLLEEFHCHYHQPESEFSNILKKVKENGSCTELHRGIYSAYFDLIICVNLL